MGMAKRRVLISFDEEFVVALEAESESLSSQINEAMRAELDPRRHRTQMH